MEQPKSVHGENIKKNLNGNKKIKMVEIHGISLEQKKICG